MDDWDNNQPWYHGSPCELKVLRAGSTITQIRHLAEVFSHKPEIVSISDDGTIQHNGVLPGVLYVVDEPVKAEDVYPHPRTTMPDRWEWLTERELRLRLIGPVERISGEVLTPEDIEKLRERARARGLKP
ncbi:MAG: hypothetical protein M1546_21260 [Chloroflexi bacterium]|nr:hypothetical protein [Chloroflexota bacterium]